MLKSIREDAGLSQHTVARRLNISTQHLMRIEQGVYAHLNDEVAAVYSELSRLTPTTESIGSLKEGYAHEINVRRSLVKQRLQLNVNWDDAPVGNFPRLREFLGWDSRIGFCKDLAVHPASLQHYEKGKARKLPYDLEEALVAIGTPPRIIDSLRPATKGIATKGIQHG